MTDFDLEQWLPEFLAEADEHLNKLNEDLMKLEKLAHQSQSPSLEVVDRMFRGFHTLKGLAGMLGFSQISELAHAAENLLVKLKSGETPLTLLLVDALFATQGKVRQLVENISKEGERESDISAELSELKAILNQGRKPFKGQVGEAPFRSSQVWNITVPYSQFTVKRSLSSFLKRLDRLGQITKVESSFEMPPPLSQFDLASFDIEVKVVFETAESETKLRKLLPAKAQIKEVKSNEPKEKKEGGEKLEKATQSFIRVNITHLDNLLNLAGELVIAKTGLAEAVQALTKRWVNHELVFPLVELSDRISGLVDQFQEEVMLARMVPLAQLFNRFPPLVREVARGAGKEVILQIEGETTRLDKKVVEILEDPLVHLLRNAIDHGIETPDERQKKGKDKVGQLKIFAYQEGDYVVIEASDDGRGLDVKKIAQTAVETGHLDSEKDWSEEELVNLVFTPGFSTSSKVTKMSGRGVGLDVVKKALLSVRGDVSLKSEAGKGTTFVLRIPLTLAIVKSLLFRVNEGLFALPLFAVSEVSSAQREKVKQVQEESIMDLRGELIPLLVLKQLFYQERTSLDSLPVVVAEAGNRRLGLVVDEIIGHQEVVVKPFEHLSGLVGGVVGAAILGSGEIALILDATNLIAQLEQDHHGVEVVRSGS